MERRDYIGMGEDADEVHENGALPVGVVLVNGIPGRGRPGCIRKGSTAGTGKISRGRCRVCGAGQFRGRSIS